MGHMYAHLPTQTLQDPAKRAALDETRERVEVERVARQLMVQQREAAVWRKVHLDPHS